jgi:hypothetical protein
VTAVAVTAAMPSAAVGPGESGKWTRVGGRRRREDSPFPPLAAIAAAAAAVGLHASLRIYN